MEIVARDLSKKTEEQNNVECRTEEGVGWRNVLSKPEDIVNLKLLLFFYSIFCCSAVLLKIPQFIINSMYRKSHHIEVRSVDMIDCSNAF
jgi:hypothetical protein